GDQPIARRSAGEDHRQYDVFDGRPRGDQVERLEDDPDGRRSETGQLAPRELVEVPPAYMQFARAGPVETAQQVQKRRLPRPRLAEQGHPFAVRDLDRDAPQHFDPGVLRPVRLPNVDRPDRHPVRSVAIRSHPGPTSIRSARPIPLDGRISYQVTRPPPGP